MKIGKYFTLDELTVSETAARHGLSNTPSMEARENLTKLVVYVLDPLRQLVGSPVIVTSGYRSPQVNQLVGGSKNSQHVLGQAADIIVPGYSVEEVMRMVRAANLPFDQLIDEFGRWVHVSYSPRMRKEVLLARRVDGRTVYRPV